MSDVSVEVLELSVRAKNLLQRNRINTVEALMNVSQDELTHFRGMGAKTLSEIENVKEDIIKIGIENIPNPREIIDEIEEDIELKQEVLDELQTHSIHELELSNYILSMLIESGYETLDKILSLSEIQMDSNLAIIIGKNSTTKVKKARNKWMIDNKELINSYYHYADSLQAKPIYHELSHILHPLVDIPAVRLLYSCISNGIDEKIANLKLNDFTKYDFILLIKEIKPLYQGLIRFISLNVAEKTDYFTEEHITDIIEKTIKNEELQSAIYDLINYHGLCIRDNEYYMLKKSSISQYLESLEESEKKEIIEERLSGKTLQEIGDKYGLTRERIRQVSINYAKQIPMLKEDYYRYPYEFFNFNATLFQSVFPDMGKQTFEYLTLKKYEKGKKELNKENFEQYNGLFETQIEAYLDRDEKIKWKKGLTRQKILWRVLVSNGDRYVSKEQLEQLYNKFLLDNKVETTKYTYNTYSVNNQLRSSVHVVFNDEGSFRYYEYDASHLWNKIDFSQYNNSIISAELIYRDYLELMDEYEIWNGYELYCLLKNTQHSVENCIGLDINFRRIPMVIVGKGDEEQQVNRFIKEVAPIEYWDFYTAYEERYGTKKESASANLAKYIEAYYMDGKYVVDLPGMSPLDENHFKIALSERDIWMMEELDELFGKICIHSTRDALNASTLYKVGFLLMAGYAYNRKYQNVTKCFETILLNDEIIDLNKTYSFSRLPSFNSVIYNLKNSLDYVEVSPKIWASRKFIEREYGLTEEEMLTLQNEISAFYTDKYYNADSLWEKIQNIPLIQKLNGNKWMCTSILRQQAGQYSLPIVGAIILSQDKNQLSVANICKWIVENEGKMSLERLTGRFNDLFGSTIEKSKVAFKLREQNIMEEIITDGIEEYIEQLISNTSEDNVSEESFFTEDFF